MSGRKGKSQSIEMKSRTNQMTADVEDDEFGKTLSDVISKINDQIEEETEFNVPESASVGDIASRLQNLRTDDPTYDVAMNEILEKRVATFYKTQGLPPQLPISEFVLRDNVLYHKTTNARLESKSGKSLKASTISKLGMPILRELKIQVPKTKTRALDPQVIDTEVKETEVKELTAVKQKIDNTEFKDDDDIISISNEIHTDLTSSPTNAYFTMREMLGLDAALQRTRGELVNNLAKLSVLDEHIAYEKTKLANETISEDMRERILERIKVMESERLPRLEAASTNRTALRSQINRIKESIQIVLNEDTTLRERLRILFREQGITIASILTAIGFIISTLVLALTPGPVAVAPSPSPSNSSGVKDWIKKQLTYIADLLKSLAGKAVAALPGIIGTIVSWLLKTSSDLLVWLGEHIWALVVGSVALIVTFVKQRYRVR